MSANTTVNLAAAPAPGAAFYLAAGCGGATTSTATVSAGSSTTTFYFRDTAAGSVTVNATSTGYTGASQAETINPDVPAVIVITSAPQTLQANVCSAAVTLQARDQFGNASPVAGGATVNLSAAPAGGFTFYSAATCASGAVTSVAIAAASSSASFWFKGTVAQPVTVSMSAGGYTGASQGETINPRPRPSWSSRTCRSPWSPAAARAR